MGTILVAGILLLIVGGIVRGMIRSRKQGKSCCDGTCAHCKGCHH